jgi:hypothetical protein
MPRKPAVGAPKRRVKSYEVVVLKKAIDEGRKELNDGEYWHVVNILRKLVDFNDSAAMSELDIKPIDGIYELREKGGLLGKKNMRFFFDAFPKANKLVIARAYRKDEEDQTPRHIIINAHTRLAQWKKEKLTVGAVFRTK